MKNIVFTLVLVIGALVYMWSNVQANNLIALMQDEKHHVDRTVELNQLAPRIGLKNAEECRALYASYQLHHTR